MKKLILILLSFQLIFFPAIINAQDIKVDTEAPGKNQAGLDKAPNGVPLVNIVAPSAKGVSHNKFKEYNVQKQGVILNNSVQVGQSQLGGMVYGNPNLQPKRRAADIVLNEVTGVTETSLLGYTEMFGKSAEFVLANPNGIIVSGAGFINIPRVTLTTGTPQMDEFGDLQGLEVDQGMILINEAMLNGENIDALEIISRAAKIEQEIRAGKYLGIKTGRNYYDYKDKTLTPKADDGSDKPIVAIDASLLGGMYAGRIFLIATEKGVGVNSEDGIGANIEDVTITANGDVVLKKDIAAKTDINIKSAGDITLQDTSYAQGNINLEAE
ncbi:MAG: filamentous hemagglutinin N-terminal domain-containing protein, partial [Deltaproteobacteria bacterium]|nr:filamentous hemagglutinin N-terminal domain-containing protein [Deltaproteobacteria bacterium]